MAKKQQSPYPLRLSDDLKHRVSLDAKREHRSINAWLITAAEEKLAKKEQKERAA